MNRRFIASLVFVALTTGAAAAADLPPQTFVTPPPVPRYDWTGFYVTGGGGYGLWSADTTTVDPTTGLCDLCLNQRQGGEGWFGRIGGGFDYQFGVPFGPWHARFVAGPMADVDFSGFRGTIQDQGPFFAGSINENWSWAAGGRIGLLTAPNILSYVNVGYTQTHFGSAAMADTGTGAPTGFSTSAFSKGGWFLGGGIETPLTFILPPGWFLRSEYRYSYFGSSTLTDTCAAGCTAFSPQDNITFKPMVQTISTQIVYKFNWTP